MTTTQQEAPSLTVASPQQAVSLLIQGVQVAQQRGAYQLNEASLLSEAVSFLTGGPTVDDAFQDTVAEAEEGSEDSEDTEDAEETAETVES